MGEQTGANCETKEAESQAASIMLLQSHGSFVSEETHALSRKKHRLWCCDVIEQLQRNHPQTFLLVGWYKKDNAFFIIGSAEPLLNFLIDDLDPRTRIYSDSLH
ncbi:hypothetical protein PM082_003141 [Marasmius tenuissimus]|nr:hypothetical protein PM082_003141 [Marasmius tenuissimus]